MQYGEIIKALRKEKGLTQDELGSIVGRKQNQISEWESGKISPSPEDIIGLCKALDTSILKFYGLENEYDIAVEVAKGKGLSPEETIKAIEIYEIYKNK